MRRWVPVVAPLVIAALFAWLGHPTRAWVLVALAAVVFVLVLAGVPVERYVERGAARLAHWLGVVLGTGVGLLLVAAGGLLRLVGRDPLTPRRDRDGGWRPAPSREDGVLLAPSTFGLEGSRAGAAGERTWRTAARAGVLAIGVLALLVLVDLGIGLTWERLTGAGAPLETVQTRMNFTGNQDTVADIRADLPAMAAYPWADAYFREIQRTPYGYWPFTETKPLGFEGEYVNLEGWTRRTYEPPDLPADAPVVWMFGGSTTWGEGQRDEYTIASYLARIAEEQGTPIKVVNYGQRGWTHFQEMILFEQLLAAEPPPDVAIFYDGANEINAQTLGAKGVPTHTLADQYAEKLAGQPIQAGTIDGSSPASAASLAWEAYVGHSAVRKVGRWLRATFDPPASATVSAGSQDGDDRDLGVDYVKTQVDGERALNVYERGRSLSSFLAAEHGVEPLFLWQPQMAGPVEVWVNDNMTAPTVDISDALDPRPDVYIDGGHTNEEGARLVAERIWPDLRNALLAGGGRLPVATEERRPAGSGAGAPSAAEAISSLEASFGRVIADPCDLGTWSAQLGTLRATTPLEADRIGSLASQFFTALAAQVPPDQQATRAALESAAAQVMGQAADVDLVADRPLVRQLPLAQDEVFVSSVQIALGLVASQSGC